MVSTPTRIVRWTIAGLAILGLLASCGDDDEPSSTASTPSTATTAASDSAPSGDVCADREALSSSVQALEDLDVRTEGTEGLPATITSLKGDLAALQDSVDDEVKPQVQAVQDSVDELETAVDNIDSDGAAQAATAVASVATAAATLLDSLESAGC